MGICQLNKSQQDAFASQTEVFQGVQLGYGSYQDHNRNQVRGYWIVLSSVLAIILDEHIYDEMEQFAAATWRPTQPTRGATLEARYHLWWENLLPVTTITHVDASRAFMYNVLANPNAPPPPPPRPTLIPGAPSGRGPLPVVAGHLPFHTTAVDNEVFYRWESWPQSRKLHQATDSIDQWTFASPQSELPFGPTGFSAVARMALPSFFPAIFRWRIQPVLGSSILCGAVVPMFGQSGGGVEVCFDQPAQNVGPIANPVVLAPL